MTMCMDEFVSYKPQVGDEICVVKRTFAGKEDPVVIATKVVTIGNKYFTTAAYPSYRFSIAGKNLHKDINSFPSNYILYPSVIAYEDRLEVTNLLNVIVKSLTNRSSNDSRLSTDLPLADVEKACELLRINNL